MHRIWILHRMNTQKEYMKLTLEKTSNMTIEYQKKPVSKAESNKKVRTPANLLFYRTKEQLSLSYDHRSPQARLRKLRKTKSPYLSDRKLIKFLISFSVPTEKKQEPTKEYNLYINTPLSPRGTKTVLENKTKKEEMYQKERLIYQIGSKYRMHYYQETLKLWIYPLHILQYASEELSSAIAEGCHIRSPFRYLRKILNEAMRKAGLRLLFSIYYKKLAFAKAQPKKPQPQTATQPPSPRQITPSKYNDLPQMTQEEIFEKIKKEWGIDLSPNKNAPAFETRA